MDTTTMPAPIPSILDPAGLRAVLRSSATTVLAGLVAVSFLDRSMAWLATDLPAGNG